MGIEIIASGKEKSKPQLKFEVGEALKASKENLNAGAIMSGDRLNYAAALADATTLEGAGASCARFHVTAPQLLVILGGRLKLIGREVRILMTTFPVLLRALDPSSALISEELTRRIKDEEKVIDAAIKHVKELTASVETGAEEASAALEDALADLEHKYDELDLMIADNERVTAGELALVPELERYHEYFTSLVALLKPWVHPPATFKEKIDCLEGNQVRVDLFLRLHTALGLGTKSSYFHGIVAHSTQFITFMKCFFSRYSPSGPTLPTSRAL